jgi:hypothetical protein
MTLATTTAAAALVASPDRSPRPPSSRTARSRSAWYPTSRASTPTSAAGLGRGGPAGARGLRRLGRRHARRDRLADHQNKPDVGSNVARQYYDVDQVDVIVDVPNSAVALAINGVTREKNKVFLNSGAATSALTGEQCSPNTVHWTYDTVALANGTGTALTKAGGDSWYFLTADYAFGHALERDTTAVVARTAARCWAACATR